MRVQRSRRRFLKYTLAGTGTVFAASSWWFSTSHGRLARLARQLADDTRRRILPAPVKPDPTKWSDHNVSLCWIGHTTVLINFYGIRILTDPVFGNRIGVSVGLGTLGPKRYVKPALSLKELPPVDVILLSHAHMDHMDLGSLGYFPKDTFVATAKDTSDVVACAGFKQPTELAWNEQATFRSSRGDLKIEAFQVKHWGERWPSEKPRGYNGYILRREDKAILFGGDTAHTIHFSELRPRGPFDVAIMPIGAYDPWIRNHSNPEQAVDMADHAGARFVVPVHHQTFRLSNEPMKEPIERLEAALQKEPQRIAVRQIGETFLCPKV
jgi:L-ascorbate metabolism protein UlaG (beta-lactamase superfamily)